ncbi:MAG: hypothetical protein J3Q66DRAFT_351863 [Benniella sp.]|nr:MAG: hypothetical protein J3Q66DRAFT_351863 [Benniella sp.]
MVRSHTSHPSHPSHHRNCALLSLPPPLLQSCNPSLFASRFTLAPHLPSSPIPLTNPGFRFGFIFGRCRCKYPWLCCPTSKAMHVGVLWCCVTSCCVVLCCSSMRGGNNRGCTSVADTLGSHGKACPNPQQSRNRDVTPTGEKKGFVVYQRSND